MRQLTWFLCVILFISACRDKVICPAFQSAYILDDSVRIAYFSYLWKLDEVERISYLEKKRVQKQDSGLVALATDSLVIDPLPTKGKDDIDYFAYVEPLIVPERPVKKTKYGIIKHEPYLLKNYRMRTAPMENVLTPVPEEEIQPLADESALAVNIKSDSTLSVTTELDSMNVAVEAGGMDTTSLPSSDVLADATPAKKEKKAPRYLFKYDPKDHFNVEQEYYNKWFGEQLVYKPPKPRPPVEPLAKDSVVQDVEVIDPANIVVDKEPKDAEGQQVEPNDVTPPDQGNTEPESNTTPEPPPEEPQEQEPRDQPPVEIESVPQDDGF